MLYNELSTINCNRPKVPTITNNNNNYILAGHSTKRYTCIINYKVIFLD